MNDKEKQEYLEGYKKAKEKGVPFFPDILYKDAIVSLIVFLVIIGLAYFIVAPLEERANPADTSYTPRPEWYFVFLFQLLKYFPPQLEVIGVVVIPTLAIILLFLLPFIDRSSKRYFSSRPVIIGITVALIVGGIFLTVQSYLEAPPPVEAAIGDKTAALYLENCAPCHGSSIAVQEGVNLHAVIAQGKHEGMPAWSGDLTSDEIDALAGFILSPGGSQLFTENCGACHEVSELVASDPIELKEAISTGKSFPAHAEVDIPDWSEVLSGENQTKLLNFLVAPDGQRLYAVDCSPCHGQSIAFSGDAEALKTIISQGGLHLDMPPWQEKLNEAELDLLARYVVDPASIPDGKQLFDRNCSSCHGERIPQAENVEQARQIILQGGEHQTMPVWGNVLTAEQLDALVDYTLSSAQGTSTAAGQQAYLQYCVVCHGEFGEGGPNPSRAGDIILPISTSEYLKTRDDFTLRSIIAQGQPNFGMSPFGSAFGGPLDDEEIDSIVSFIRAWEANPPVELPPEVAISGETVSLDAEHVYTQLCAQCHGLNGEGGIGPSFQDPQLQKNRTDEQLFDTINLGHEATAMIGWGDVLSVEQIQQLVQVIRRFARASTEEPTATPAGAPSFTADVLPIFEDKCIVCHGNLGGWDASSYEKAMTTGDNAPVIIPGNVEESLLAQKLQGTQAEGTVMPPAGKLPDAQIQVILDWIEAGAEE